MEIPRFFFKEKNPDIFMEGQNVVNVSTLFTDIWLVVNVPVLSEQITDVHPRVSTDGNERTMAFFFAIRLVP